MQTVGTVLLIIVVLAALLFVQLHRGPAAHLVSRPEVTLADVPRVFQLLTAVPKDGHFAVFLFGPNGEAPAQVDALNVQFSIEGGHAGLDWVLLAPLNIAAKERVTAFLASHGYTPQEREMNKVRYLRIEGGDLPSVCRQLLIEVFGVTPTEEMGLILEGFEWPA